MTRRRKNSIVLGVLLVGYVLVYFFMMLGTTTISDDCNVRCDSDILLQSNKQLHLVRQTDGQQSIVKGDVISTRRPVIAFPPVGQGSNSSVKYIEEPEPTTNQFKPVIILTYQRTGSSFFGNLFNLDPRVFYVFEPLDALYSSLYGTEPGWNVPSDIVSYNNGTERVIPLDEVSSVSSYLNDLLSCSVHRLPTELLAHGFWHLRYHHVANDTAASVLLAPCTADTRQAVKKASNSLILTCGQRFSDCDDGDHTRCRRLLHDATYREEMVKMHQVGDVFTKYRHTMDKVLRRMINGTCVPIYRTLCDTRPVRVTKLVRASMLSIKPLLDWLPDLKVIHLVRDPRAVALSRRDFDGSGRAQFSELTRNLSEQIIREASIYCRQIVNDVRWRRRLERQFPGRLYSLTYEQLVEDPAGVAKDIYRFIDETTWPGVIDQFVKMADGNGNVTAHWLATRWLQDRISRLEFQEINKHCSRLFHYYPQYMRLIPRVYRTKDVVVSKPTPNLGFGQFAISRNIPALRYTSLRYSPAESFLVTRHR